MNFFCFVQTAAALLSGFIISLLEFVGLFSPNMNCVSNFWLIFFCFLVLSVSYCDLTFFEISKPKKWKGCYIFVKYLFGKSERQELIFV